MFFDEDGEPINTEMLTTDPLQTEPEVKKTQEDTK